jgi:RNA polymerase sigma-70 factor, ECF subfamily
LDVDADLVEMLRRGESRAVEPLVERHGDRLYRLAARITGLPQTAEGIVGDAMQFAAQNIEQLRGDVSFGAWLGRIVARAAYQTLARRQVRKELVLDDVLPALDGDGRHFEPMEDWSTGIETHDASGRLADVLSEALDALPADYRTALVLRDMEGWPAEDVATTLGVSLPIAKAWIHHARLFVRQQVSAFLRVA